MALNNEIDEFIYAHNEHITIAVFWGMCAMLGRSPPFVKSNVKASGFTASNIIVAQEFTAMVAD